MTRSFGPLCPEGHGLLIDRDEWTRKGVLWCSDSAHGGNGRFYRTTEVEDGWFDPDAKRVRSAWQLEQDAKADKARKAEMTDTTTPAPEKPKAEAKPRKGKEPRECTCGCGGMTKGGAFLPGHDAKFHSRLKQEAEQATQAANPDGYSLDAAPKA